MAHTRGLRPLWLALGWCWAMAIVWLSLMRSPPTIDVEQADKLGHLLGYGLLMFWFCQLYAAQRTRLGYALGFAALGIGLELVQRALGYRSYEPLDMVANTVGVAIGWATALAGGGQLLARIEASFGHPRT